MPKDPHRFYHSKSVPIKKKMVIKHNHNDLLKIPPLQLSESFFSMMQRQNEEMVKGMQLLSLENKATPVKISEEIHSNNELKPAQLQRCLTDQYSYFSGPIELNGENYQTNNAIDILLSNPK